MKSLLSAMQCSHSSDTFTTTREEEMCVMLKQHHATGVRGSAAQHLLQVTVDRQARGMMAMQDCSSNEWASCADPT